jgi:two-component system, LuxR family, sensor kinase FixL
MEYESRSRARAASWILPVTAGALAIGIFVVDTVTPFGVAVAVLYVVVVLMAANFCQRRGVLLVAAGCVALTVMSYLLSHGDTYTDEASVRGIMSLSAIGITTFLALKSQSADTALRERARLLDLTHDTIFVRDMNDVITYWNRGAEELYGWKKEDAVGKVTHRLLQTIFPAPLEEITATLRRTGRWEGELVHMKRDGTPVIVASRWSMQQDARGQQIGTLETNNDITERKRADEQLRRTQAELAHITRVTTLGELTSSIAHEVKQPLAGVITNAGAGLRWLAGQSPDVEEARQAFGRIIKDGNRADEVIDRIRALVRKAPTRKDRLDINEIVQEVVALTRGEAHRNHVSLQPQLSNGLPRISGDRIQLQQVILNLIINAIEAMRGADAGPREVLIGSGTDDAHGVLIAVRDSGMGLDPERLDHLFDAFYTTKPEGLGMGLAISRSIVEAHGGRLWATPNVPQGAIFQFMLPADEEEH